MKKFRKKVINYSYKTGLKARHYLRKLSHPGLSFLIIAVFVFNVSGFLVVQKINEYQEKKQRTPFYPRFILG